MRVYILALQEQISVAEKLLEDIGNAKIISRPLLDEVTKEISTNFKKNIRNADVILVIIDEKFANNITLNTELQIALMECKRNKNKLLLPIILDDAAVPTALESMIYIKCNLKSQADIEKTKFLCSGQETGDTCNKRLCGGWFCGSHQRTVGVPAV